MRYGISRSAEPVTFQGFPLKSVTPFVSVTTTGYCAPATAPAEIGIGLPVIVMRISLFDPAGPSCSVHVAFTAHAMSATELVVAPEHAAGPLLTAAPQSLSVTRM